MSFDEIDLKNRIQEQTRDLQIPDSLKPEAIERKLSDENKKKKKRNNVYYMRVAAAACFVLLIGIVGGRLALHNPEDGDAKSEVTEEHLKVQESDAGTEGGVDDAAADAAEDAAANPVRTAADYDEIYEYIKAEQNVARDYEVGSGFVGGMFSDGGFASGGNGGVKEFAMEDSAADTNASGIAQQAVTEAGVEYSDTNTREEDVGEADIVKTDGKHLYILYGNRVEIVDIEQDEMRDLGEIVLDDNVNVAEIYLQDARLIVVYTENREEGGGEYTSYRAYAAAETFDVSDPSKPKSVGKITQSGRYYTTRIRDGYVYLFSNYYADYDVARTYEDGFVPTVNGQRVDAGNVYLPMLDTARKYLVVSSFSLESPDKVTDNKAIFGDTDLCYVSGNNIYACENSYDYAESSGKTKKGVSQTNIRKIAYQDGKLSAVGQTKLDGTINDSFSIDEYEGNLRLVTTVRPLVSHDDGVMPLWTTDFVPWRATDDVAKVTEETEAEKDSNSLYVLDENLKELGRIEGLAEDEQVYSARFMGDTGYFVTFRQVDPLFSVDLSDPKNPKIIGKLKMPGFSDYLHPYGDGKLLGIGMDVDEEGMTTNGVKLSMFDISNPADVKEAHKYVLEGTYSTDVSYNYKAAFVDAKKNLIGFNAYGDGAHYYIFSYGKDGFECLFDRELIGVSSDVRALYAGNRLYLVAGNTVVSYRLETFEKIDDIVLGADARPTPRMEIDEATESEQSGWLELEGE